MFISAFSKIPENLTKKSYAQSYAQVLGSYAQVLGSYAQSYAQAGKHYKNKAIYCTKSNGYIKNEFRR